MKTNVEDLRIGHTFRQNHRAKFKRAIIWCLGFFAITSLKTQSQETTFSTNSVPEISTNSVALPDASTNEVQQAQSISSSPTPSVSQSSSGAMAWPGGAAPSTSRSKSVSTEGSMAWPTGGTPAASVQKNSYGSSMAWPNGTAPSTSHPTSTSTKGVMVWPGMATSAYAPPPAPASVAPAAAQVAPAAVTPPPTTAPVSATPSTPTPVPPPPPVETTAQVPPAPATEQPSTATTDFMAPPPMLQAPKSTKNEVSASGDLMFGEGQVSLPLGYSLNKALGGGTPSEQGAFTVPRNSTYYGGTLSYSYGQAWFIDASIAQGHSSGSQSIPTGFLGNIPSTFSIDDTWYQVYLKYTFPQLRGKRFSAYLRVGASYVSATLKDNANSTAVGAYTQTDDTQDILGNVGVGLSYSLYTTHKLHIDLQGEVEGFGGVRHQQSTEALPLHDLFGPAVDIDNTLYGGIGRATIHTEYRMGKSGLFKIFGDVGIEGRYDIIKYSDSANSSPNEYLWGPYLKLGLRYDF